MKRLFALLAVLALVLVACGGGAGTGDSPATTAPAAPGGDPAAGQAIYASTCASCHGPDATGLPGLGANLHNNEFVDGLSDDELVAFLKVGRPAGDPANEAGVDMPPKGGNPSLTDDDLYDVAAYLRTLD